MPEDRTDPANTPTDSGNAVENAKALFDDVDANPAAGQDVISSESNPTGQQGKEAPAPAPAAPTGQPATPAKELPYLLKVDPSKFDKEHAEFLKSRGILKDDGSYDPVTGVKSWREAVQNFTKAQQAIHTYEGQLRSLQVEDKPEQELTKEVIKKEYQENRGELMEVLDFFKKLQGNTATADDIQGFNSWIQTSLQELDDAKEEKMEIVRLNTWRKETGQTKPNSLQNINELRQKSNENIAPALNDAERADSNKALSIIKNVSPIVRRIAAVAYPKLFNKGTTDEEKTKNSELAVYRLLAEDGPMTAELVGVGRAMDVANNIEAIKKAEYERGKTDALKGIGGGGNPPTPNSVKPLPTDEKESAVQTAKGLFNDIN